jgi:alkanesulfonate monooxygenase SsuD/methylene tetrahydromethanopterin reductase-like flavin-dependent oxidoreductase (luciferase family)
VGRLPIWLGLGGTLESAVRAGTLGLPVVLATISKPPAELAGQITAYRDRFAAAGHDPARQRVALATHFYVAPQSQSARDEFYPHYSAYASRGSASRAVPRELFEARASATGPIFVGSPQEIIDKVMYERGLFSHDRFLAQLDIGGLPYAKVARSIELLATKVMPALR